jgi:hypothetical protein
MAGPQGRSPFLEAIYKSNKKGFLVQSKCAQLVVGRATTVEPPNPYKYRTIAVDRRFFGSFDARTISKRVSSLNVQDASLGNPFGYGDPTRIAAGTYKHVVTVSVG